MESFWKQGFTLIELLVVIAIVAVLSVVVVLSLNPAELLRQARDSDRVSDTAILKSAVSLFLVDGLATSSLSLGTSNKCYIDGPATNTCVGWFSSQLASNGTSTTSTRSVNGGGWVPINFSLLSAGSPMSAEPIDPVNNSSYFYSYISTTTSNGFKLAALMESIKYSASGTSDFESTDGGTSTSTYEQGTNLSL